MNISIKPYNESFFSLGFENRFTDKMLQAVRKVPGRKYLADEKIWLIPDNQNAKDELLRNLFETGLFNYDVSNAGRPAGSKNSELSKMKELLEARHYSAHTVSCYLKSQCFNSESGSGGAFVLF